jgi:hypothetical protein
MDLKKETSIEDFKMTGSWDAQSKNLKGKFAQLNDADVKFEVGKEEELVTRISEKLNKKRDEVINILKKGQTATA